MFYLPSVSYRKTKLHNNKAVQSTYFLPPVSFGLILLLPVCKLKEHSKLFDRFSQLGTRVVRLRVPGNLAVPFFSSANCYCICAPTVLNLVKFFSFYVYEQNNRFVTLGFLISGNFCSSSFFSGLAHVFSGDRFSLNCRFVSLLYSINRLFLKNANIPSIITLLTHEENQNK